MAEADGTTELVLRCRVRAREAGLSLLAFLAQRFRYVSREGWDRAIREGRVTVDGRRVEGRTPLRAGVEIATRQSLREPAAPTDVRIVHDACGVLVVDKPAGLPFHADGAFVTRTLVAVLRARLGEGLLPLQRLDRETSGLCLFARDATTARALRTAIDAGALDKRYDAIVHGRVAVDDGVLDGWIGRAHGSSITLRRGIVPPHEPGAQSARTEFAVIARGDATSLLRCRLVTGRTHQLRVHLEGAGHPIVGDKLYGRSDDEYLAWVAHVKAGGDAAWGGRLGAARQLLHAASLRVPALAASPALALTAPWPDDFAVAARAAGPAPAP